MLDRLKSAPRDLMNFYGAVKTELKKVTWPGKQEVYGTTVIVLVTVFFFGLYLFAVDFVVDWILRNVVESIFALR